MSKNGLRMGLRMGFLSFLRIQMEVRMMREQTWKIQFPTYVTFHNPISTKHSRSNQQATLLKNLTETSIRDYDTIGLREEKKNI